MIIKIIKDLSAGTEYKVLHIEYNGGGNIYLLKNLKKKEVVACYHDVNKSLFSVPLTHACVFKKEKILDGTGRVMAEYTIKETGQVYKRAP
jgi:hypothetical protein